MLQSLQEMTIYFAAIIAAILLFGIAFYKRIFIRGQFAEMSDSDKLESPTYEEMESGVVVTTEDDEE
ncbi:MAG: hypothetical protein ACFFEF_09690 [Candidatus Thorarchaeota archaeon]